MTSKHIFIIGAGTMGNGIAQVAATSGYDVTCMDLMPAALEKAKAAISKSTAKLLEKGTLTAEQKAGADKINYVSSYDTLPTADFVIELPRSESFVLALGVSGALGTYLVWRRRPHVTPAPVVEPAR